MILNKTKWQHVDGVYSEVTSSLADSDAFFIILQTRLSRALTIGKEKKTRAMPRLEVRDALCLKRAS